MSSHEVDSVMLYIHPPLAILGYVFVFLFLLFLLRVNNCEKKTVRLLGLTGWLFAFSGLTTGMVWAQIAWGSYWSLDPKETLTLVFFLAVSVSQVACFEQKIRLAKWSAVLSCVLSVLTAFSSFIIAGLHSFL